MGWGSDFIAALSQSAIVPIYELEFLALPNGFAGGFTLSSTGGGQARIADNSPRCYGTSVIPGRWNVSFGGFDVDIVGDLRPFAAKISKGIYAILRCSIVSSAGTSPFEIIGYGQLYSISGGRETFSLKFRDLLTALQTSSSIITAGAKHSTSTEYPEYRMFTNAGRATQLTNPWNGSALTLDVEEIGIFEKESSVNGLVKCENLSTSKLFYLQWSGAAVTSAPRGTITLTSAVAKYPSQDASVALATGITNNKISNAVRLKGTPWLIMAKILQSTGDNNPAGTGSHGTLDTYPITWSAGGGFDPDIFDYADAATMSEYVRTSTGTAYQWEIVLDSVPSDGFRYLTGVAAETGQWPVWRQGAVSWRAAIDPTGIRCFQQPIVSTSISDIDIISINSHEWFSPDINQNFGVSKMMITPNWLSGIESFNAVVATVSTGKIKGLPAQTYRTYDASQTYKQTSPHVPLDMANADLQRLKGWDGYNHESLTLQVKLKYAILCAGDIVEISSEFLYGKDQAPGATYTNTRAMVTGVDFSISEQLCNINLAILPGRYL